MAKPQRAIMQSEQPKVETCANRFELISRWGQPIDDAWAHAMLAKWLADRVDSTDLTVYDQGEPAKGDHHG
jgi:hypothetical protein